MPNKTLYVKDADLPLFEQAQEQLGDSVSSMFAEFLRERVASLTPEEGRIVELMNQISRDREVAHKARNLPQFIDAEYGEAEEHCKKALKSFQRGDIRKTKVFFLPQPRTGPKLSVTSKKQGISPKKWPKCLTEPRQSIAFKTRSNAPVAAKR